MIKKVAILQTAFLGDAVLISPMINAVKQFYGNNVQIYLIIKKGIEPVFKHNPQITKIISFDKYKSQKSILGLLKFILHIKKQRFDVFINVHRSFRSGLITVLSGSKIKIGFKDAVLSFLFSSSIKRKGTHEVFKNHKLLQLIDYDFKKLEPNIHDSYKLYSDCEFTEQSKNIVIAAGSRWNTKRWNLNGFVDLSKMIIEKTNYNIIFTGDNNDVEFIDEIIKELEQTTDIKQKVLNVCGKLNLNELICVIQNCLLLISNDSAPQHIAVGFNKPVIAIFGPTTKNLGYYPFSNKAFVIENNKTQCRPCGKHGHDKCPINTHECMTSISADEVFKQVQKLISSDNT